MCREYSRLQRKKLRNQLKAYFPNNFKENFTEVSNEYKKITLYFNNIRINDNWEKIKFSLEIMNLSSKNWMKDILLY